MKLGSLDESVSSVDKMLVPDTSAAGLLSSILSIIVLFEYSMRCVIARNAFVKTAVGYIRFCSLLHSWFYNYIYAC